MSQIDSFKLVPVWRLIGQLKGYLGGLNFRLTRSPEELPVEIKDIETLQGLVNDLDKTLDRIVFGKSK